MARERQSHFGAGEVSPSLYERTDLKQHSTGAKKLTNMLVTKYGTLVNRPGTRYVSANYNSAYKSRLFRFDFSDSEQFAVEVNGGGAMPVTQKGGTRLSSPLYVALGQISAANGTMAARNTSVPTAAWTNDTGGIADATSIVEIAVADAPVGDAKNVRMVAVSLAGAVYISDNAGDTWVLTATSIAGLTGLTSVAYHDGKWVIAGATGAGAFVWWSATAADGTWTAVAVPWTGVNHTTLGGSADSLVAHAGTGATYKAYFFRKNGWTPLANFAAFVKGTTTIGASRAKFLPISGGRWLMYGPTGLSYILDLRTGYVNYQGEGSLTLSGNVNHFIDLGGGDGTHLAAFAGQYSAESYDGGKSWVGAVTLTSLPNSVVFGAKLIGDTIVILQALAAIWTISTSPKAYSATSWTVRHTVNGTSGMGTYGSLAAVPGYVTVPFSVASPWNESDLPYLRATQSGNQVIFTCRGRESYVLSRLANGSNSYDWKLDPWFSTPPTTGTPATPTLASPATPATDGVDVDHPAKVWSWKVSAVDRNGVETLPSAALTPVAMALYDDRPATITWAATGSAERYFIYRGRNNMYGYVGTVIPADATTAVTFKDDGQLPIVTRSPRTWDRPYAVYPPSVVAFFQDRLVGANTLVGPAEIKASASGDYQNFDEKREFQVDDDPIYLTLACRRYEEVRALKELSGILFALTSEQEWRLGNPDGTPLSPNDPRATAVSEHGCAWVDPVVVGEEIVFVQSQGNVVRAVGKGGFPELSGTSDHLMLGTTILEMHYARVPWSTIWMVRSDGRLLSFTYHVDTGVAAWAEHIFLNADGTEADVESACVVTESGEDVLWVVMLRGDVRTIERMAPRAITDANDAVIVDCATVYDSTATGTIAVPQFSGTPTISVWADGVKRSLAVAAGEVTLPVNASRVAAGIAISSKVTTLDSGQAVADQKVVSKVWVQTDAAKWTWVDATVGIKAGNDTGGAQDTVFVKDKTDGIIEILIDSVTNPGGRVTVQIDDPIPVEIRGIIREVTPGQ